MLTAEVRRGRTQTVPGVKSGGARSAAYNSRILGMLTPSPSRFAGSLLFALALLFVVPSSAQNWAVAEEQLAAKIKAVSGTGSKTMALEVMNRSSLSPAMTDDIRRNLLTQLAAAGARLVAAEQATTLVRVSLSEDLQNYLWIAEVRQGANAPAIVMVSLPRPAALSVEPEPSAMVLRKFPLWSQQERILDVAITDGNPARMLVLDGSGLASYRLQDGQWRLEQSLPAIHSRPWPRDLRGRLVLRKEKDHSFDAYLPGVYCRGSASSPLAMNCYDSDEAWPVGVDPFSLNAAFTSSRNFFSGTLSPGVGQSTTAPPFYSAAAVPRDNTAWWLLAGVDGQVHLLDGTTDQVLDKVDWGSDLAAVRSGCGSGWQVLATGSGEGRSDVIRAFEIAGRVPVAASAPLDVSGTVTALWTESGGGSAVAVAHNFETGKYDAFRLTLTCGR